MIDGAYFCFQFENYDGKTFSCQICAEPIEEGEFVRSDRDFGVYSLTHEKCDDKEVRS